MTRRRSGDAKCELFQFLNVMVGMIVVLLLIMLLTLATRVIDAEEKTAEAAPIPSSIGPAPGAGQASGRSPNQSGEGDINEETFQRLRGQIDQLAAQVLDRRAQRDQLAKLQDELEALIETKQDELRLSSDDDQQGIGNWVLGKPEKIEMTPDPTVRVAKTPRFVEVKAEGFVVHEENKVTEYPLKDLKNKLSPFAKFLKKTDAIRSKEYLLILVHPNGSAAYQDLREFLSENFNEQIIRGNLIITKTRIDLGVEPFSKEWLLINRDKAK